MAHKIPQSWLDDDPEWELLRRKAEKLPISKPLKREIATHQTQRAGAEHPRFKTQTGVERSEKEMIVNVKIAFPKVKIPNIKEIYTNHKIKIHKTIGVVAIVAVLAAAPTMFSVLNNNTTEVKGTSVRDQASFTPLIPIGSKTVGNEKSKLEYTFDNEKNVLGYSTEYNGAVMTVSQQQLPEKVKNNPGELGYIAKSIRAENQLQTQNGLVYLADDINTKTQTVLFSKNNLLIFINANNRLDSSEWIFFINQLIPSH